MGGLCAELGSESLLSFKMPMPNSTRTLAHTVPQRLLCQQRKGVREINQRSEEDRLGESHWPERCFSDMRRAGSQRPPRFMNAAAQVWGVAELASLICTWCYTTPLESSYAQPRLVNLARVNKFISDAASRQLWRDLPSMRPLLSLLPFDLVIQQFDDNWDPTTSPPPVSHQHCGMRRFSHLLLGCETIACT